jgi:hypothetical protein
MASISRFFRLIPDEILQRETTSDSTDELYRLIKAVAIAVLEPEEHGLDLTFFSGTSEYYDRITKDIIDKDEIVTPFKDFVTRLRHTYPSFVEYSKYIQSLPPVKKKPAYTDVCCCCHESMNTWQRVVRLQDVSKDPNICGHAIHYECSRRLTKNESGRFSCPLCRIDLGTDITFWYDLESTVPRF